MDYKKQSSFGFTIVELLVVIVVIGILAAITIVSYTGMSQKANIASLVSDLDNASRQLKLYQVTSTTGYPTSLDANYCPIPTDSARCLKPSPGVSYTYATNNSTTPQTFCATATKGDQIYKITNDSTPVAGNCLDYGRVLYLDAGNASSYPSPFTGTVWTDLSGNNNNGTLYNGVGYSSANQGSLVFDGVNDVVKINSTPGDELNPANAITLSAWVNVTAAKSNGFFLTKGWGDNYGLLLDSSNRINFQIVHTPSTDTQAVNSTTVLTNGSWYYITAVYDMDKLKIYINGVYNNSVDYAKTISLGNQSLAIGGIPHMENSYPNNGLNGKISNVSVYGRALGAGEISQSFNILRSRYGL